MNAEPVFCRFIKAATKFVAFGAAFCVAFYGILVFSGAALLFIGYEIVYLFWFLYMSL